MIMAMKRPKKREEFDLVEHLTRSIGEMMREMGLGNHDELVVENQKVAKEYHVKGIYSIMADSDSCACHGLMPYYVVAYSDIHPHWASTTMTPKQLINVHNYVVYAYNKYVDEYNRRHYLKG